MIICNHCGKQVPAGLARCQNCGMPLSSVANRNMGAQEQDELPTWLESLRPHERPPVPPGGQPGFSTADLIDDDGLPGWMRTEQAREAGEGDSGTHRAVRPAGMPAPNTDAGMLQARSFSAHDLIDPVSLPSWMNPGQQQPAQPGVPTGQRGAAELNAYPQGVPSQFSAGDLIDRQSLPPWMASNQQVPPSPSPSATWQGNPSPPPAPQAPVNPAPPPMSMQGGPQSGLSASSLLDVNSLPPWLREGQQGQGGQPGNSNLSAGSLIDMNALPSWLRAVDGQPQIPQSQQGLQGQQAGRNVPPPYGAAPRVESARVPVRPRAEMMPPDQSEAAASVFSSVLGVASVSPQYPAPPAANQQNFAGGPAGPSGTFYAPQSAPPMTTPSGAGLAPQPVQGAIPGSYAGNYANAYPNGGPNMQNPYVANQGQPVFQQPPASVMQTGGLQGGQNSPAYAGSASARQGKRSFLDTIREWFHL